MKRTPSDQDPAQPSESAKAGKKPNNKNKNKNGGKKGDKAKNGAKGKNATDAASGNTTARRMTPKRHCTSPFVRSG